MIMKLVLNCNKARTHVFIKSLALKRYLIFGRACMSISCYKLLMVVKNVNELSVQLLAAVGIDSRLMLLIGGSYFPRRCWAVYKIL